MWKKVVDFTLPVVQALLTVLASAWAAAHLGDGTQADLVAASCVGVVMIALNALILVAPRKLRSVRALLDPRGEFEGTWVQVVRRVIQNGEGPDVRNRFGVFDVVWDDEKDGYVVHGVAYDEHGEPFASWSTLGVAQFSTGEMSYAWKGIVPGETSDPKDVSRTGLCTVDLRTGEGFVDHVWLALRLSIKISRVTPDLLKQTGFAKAAISAEDSDDFARVYAKTLKPRA